MSNDADGFNTGQDLRIDYFLPGTPEERWIVGFTKPVGDDFIQITGSNSGLEDDNQITMNSLSDACFQGSNNID